MFSRETRTEMGRLYALAWPIMLASMQWMLLNLIDTAMTGQAGAAELAYMNAGRAVMWTAWNIAFGLLSGITVFTARADGAGEREKCGDVLRQGLLYAAAVAGIIALVLIFGSARLFRLLDIPADQIAGGVSYTQVIALAMLVRISSMPITYFLEGISRPRPAMVLALLTLPLNVLLNWIFIFGKFGAPALGATGAALGTLLAVFFESLCLLFYLAYFRARAAYGLGGRWFGPWRGSWQHGKSLRRFGLAPALAAGMENIGFSLLSVLAAQLGILVAAGFQAVLAVYILALIAAIGCASAAGVRVGNAVGEKAFADISRRAWCAVFLCMGATLIFSLGFLLFPELVLRIFNEDSSQVLPLAKLMLLMVAPFIVFDAIQIVLVYALRAAGDPVFAAINQAISFLIVMVAVAWAAIHFGGRGIDGIALGLIVGVCLSALLMTVRFLWITRKGGAWISRKNPGEIRS